MEQKKSNIGLIVFLIILVLGLAGYICYDKFLTKKEPVKTEEKDNKKDINMGNEYTYEDVAGTYKFEKEIAGSKEKYGEQFTYAAYFTLLNNGIIEYNDWTHFQTGYIGNYIINGDQIMVTRWFEHGSDALLGIANDNALVYKIADKNTIVFDKCNLEPQYGSETYYDCEFERNDDLEWAKNFTGLKDYLTNSYFSNPE